MMQKIDPIIRKSRCNFKSAVLDPFAWKGGKLILSKQNLRFEPNSLEYDTSSLSIPLHNITSINARYPDFLSNRIVVLLKDGSIIEFRVPKRKEWIQDLIETTGNNLIRTDIPVIRPKSTIRFIRAVAKILAIIFSVSALTFLLQKLFTK